MGYFVALIMICLNSTGQLLFKAAAEKSKNDSAGVLNYFFILAVLSFLVIPFIVNYLFEYFSLSVVYSLTGIYYLLVNLGAKFIFKEVVKKKVWIGVGLVIIGVFIFNL